MISVKFLLVHNREGGKSLPETIFSPQETVVDMKRRAFSLWTSALPALERWEQLRLVFKGKLLKNAQYVGDVMGPSNVPEAEAVTVHMIVQTLPVLPTVNTLVHIQSTASGGHLSTEELVTGTAAATVASAFILREGIVPQSYRLEVLERPGQFLKIRKSDAMLVTNGKGGRWCDWFLLPSEDKTGCFVIKHRFTNADLKFNRLGSSTEIDDTFRIYAATPEADWPSFETVVGEPIHFHGCIPPDEQDADMLRMVFAKHQSDGLIPIQAVGDFLKKYWEFMQKLFKKHVGEKFPMPQFKAVKLQLTGRSEPGGSLTFDQFVQFWFLFDRDVPEQPCQCGQKQAILQATTELHRQFKPDTEFDTEVFDKVFAEIERGRGQLTCKEVELLYYMYSWHANVRVSVTTGPSEE